VYASPYNFGRFGQIFWPVQPLTEALVIIVDDLRVQITTM